MRDGGWGMEDKTTKSPKERLDLRAETKEYAMKVIRLYSMLPRTTIAQTLGKQLLRSGTSVGAHYREACRAKSNADFISKIEGALQELDESAYWLELIEDNGIVPKQRITPLLADIERLISVFVAMIRKVKSMPKQ